MLNWSKYHKSNKNPVDAKGIALLKPKNALLKTNSQKVASKQSKTNF